MRAALRSFELSLAAGADILSIESVGGKEVHDKALVVGDIPAIAFALGVLSPRDMAWLWSEFGKSVTARPGAVPGGDAACGFANTAMRRRPEDAAGSVGRRRSRDERGACPGGVRAGRGGPSKDCAYEGPIMKAIAGVPIAMEGKSAACAHFSRSATSPARCATCGATNRFRTCGCCRATRPRPSPNCWNTTAGSMNAASASGQAKALRDLLTAVRRMAKPSGGGLSPAATIEIASAIVSKTDPYERKSPRARRQKTLPGPGGRPVAARKERQWPDKMARRSQRSLMASFRFSSNPSTEIFTIGRATDSREGLAQGTNQRDGRNCTKRGSDRVRDLGFIYQRKAP